MSKKNRNHHKQNEIKQQAEENAVQGDAIENQLTYPPEEVPIQELTIEQETAAIKAKVDEELALEDALKASIEAQEENKPVEPTTPPTPPVEEPKPLTEVEPGKGLTPEQTAVAQALVTGKVERFPDRLRKSTHSTPVKMVHAIAEAMLKQDPSTRRTDIVKFCVSQGIAFYTARTQVQVYLKATKNDREAAAKQAELGLQTA